MEILPIFVLVISLLFLTYLIVFLIRVALTKPYNKTNVNLGKVSVVIPARNEEKCIYECVSNLIKGNSDMIKNIIIGLDNSEDNTYNICKNLSKKDSRIKIVQIKDGNPSKVKAIIRSLDYVSDKSFLLLDADIIIKKNSIKKLYSYFLENNAEIVTGIVDPLEGKGIQYQIISWDRIFRQRILQVAKSYFGMANFPGAIAVVNKEAYKMSVTHQILEDYYITLNIIKNNMEVKFLPEVVAYETERKYFIDLFFQRVRWTIGNMNLIKEFNKTLKSLSIIKKLILLSYPALWYLLYYYLTFLLVVGSIQSDNFTIVHYLMLSSSVYISLIFSKIKFGNFHIMDFLTSILFIVIFPLIISLVLLYSLALILFIDKEDIFLNRRYFMR